MNDLYQKISLLGVLFSLMMPNGAWADVSVQRVRILPAEETATTQTGIGRVLGIQSVNFSASTSTKIVEISLDYDMLGQVFRAANDRNMMVWEQMYWSMAILTDDRLQHKSTVDWDAVYELMVA